jgi:GT2 family glycosyltransferase
MNRTTIIILTRNGLELTRQCVRSIYRHTYEDFNLVFVDNGSTDGTVEFLETVPRAKLIVNRENKGFAAGNNQGLAAADGDYLLVLNNDTVATPGWLSGMVRRLENDPAIGIVGPVSNHVSGCQRIPDARYASIEELDAYARMRSRRFRDAGFYAERLVGFCMLIRRSVVETIGGFDERFYPGNYEDDDFCLRTLIGGNKLWVAPDVFVHHVGHGTFRANGESLHGALADNARKFREKWSIGSEEWKAGAYSPSLIVRREGAFDPQRHYVPLSR